MSSSESPANDNAASACAPRQVNPCAKHSRVARRPRATASSSQSRPLPTEPAPLARPEGRQETPLDVVQLTVATDDCPRVIVRHSAALQPRRPAPLVADRFHHLAPKLELTSVWLSSVDPDRDGDRHIASLVGCGLPGALRPGMGGAHPRRHPGGDVELGDLDAFRSV